MLEHQFGSEREITQFLLNMGSEDYLRKLVGAAGYAVANEINRERWADVCLQMRSKSKGSATKFLTLESVVHEIFTLLSAEWPIDARQVEAVLGYIYDGHDVPLLKIKMITRTCGRGNRSESKYLERGDIERINRYVFDEMQEMMQRTVVRKQKKNLLVLMIILSCLVCLMNVIVNLEAIPYTIAVRAFLISALWASLLSFFALEML